MSSLIFVFLCFCFLCFVCLFVISKCISLIFHTFFPSFILASFFVNLLGELCTWFDKLEFSFSFSFSCSRKELFTKKKSKKSRKSIQSLAQKLYTKRKNQPNVHFTKSESNHRSESNKIGTRKQSSLICENP